MSENLKCAALKAQDVAQRPQQDAPLRTRAPTRVPTMPPRSARAPRETPPAGPRTLARRLQDAAQTPQDVALRLQDATRRPQGGSRGLVRVGRPPHVRPVGGRVGRPHVQDMFRRPTNITTKNIGNQSTIQLDGAHSKQPAKCAARGSGALKHLIRKHKQNV